MLIYKVYVIVNLINGKMYVGCTKCDLKIRLKRHFIKANQMSMCTLYKAIRKYGKDNFNIRMIDIFSNKKDMLKSEIDWINYFDTYKSIYGYNDTLGGNGGDTNSGKKFSEEWKNKISKAKTGKVFSKKHRDNLSESHKGKIAFNRKITFDIANDIRHEYSLGKITQKQLGIKYKLSQDCVFNIIKMRTYLK